MTDPNGSATGGQPGADGGAGAGAGSTPPAGWYTGEKHKGLVELKGWHDQDAVLDSYAGLEKLMGADKAGRGVIWPKDESDAEGWKTINAKLGVPESADKYSLPLPEGDDGAFAKAISPKLLELGISTRQAEGLAKFWNEYNATQGQTIDGQSAEMVKTQKAELATEWGAAHDQNLAIAKRGAAALGYSADVIDALEQSVGYAAVMKAMLTAGQKLGEDKFVGGQEPGGQAFSPEAAKARFDQLLKDKSWVARVAAGDVNAIEERDLLNANMLGMKLGEYRDAIR